MPKHLRGDFAQEPTTDPNTVTQLEIENAELKKQLRLSPDHVEAFVICSHCNKETQAPLAKAGNATPDNICNFFNCEHCKERIDLWLLIKPLESALQEIKPND